MTNQLDWRKSSRCETAACVEIAYRTAAACESTSCVEVGHTPRCEAGNCVEVSHQPNARCEHSACIEVGHCTHAGTWHIRDSKHRDGPVLTFDQQEWDAFTAGVRNGDFDN